jgi:hypothetical protein
MATIEQGRPQGGPTSQTHEQRSGVLACKLLQALGRPTTPHRVEVRHLWENHYRANVFVGTDAASTRIAHSFFLSAGEDGNICTSAPDITRKY